MRIRVRVSLSLSLSGTQQLQSLCLSQPRGAPPSLGKWGATCWVLQPHLGQTSDTGISPEGGVRAPLAALACGQREGTGH